MRIGVYGSAAGQLDDQFYKTSRELGRTIASRGHSLLFGGCHGLPYEAALGFHDVLRGDSTNGVGVVAYSPGVDLEDHLNRFKFPEGGIDKFEFLSQENRSRENAFCMKLRNVYCVAACDAAIMISGRIGTMNEFTIAYDLGRNIGLVLGSGGFADRAMGLVEALGKKSKSAIVCAESPETIIKELEVLHQR